MCDTLFSQSPYNMFRIPGGPFFFRLTKKSRIFAGISLLLLFFPLQAIWPNNEMTIIDISTANPWGLYWPREAARHLIETPARNPLQVFVGEKLEVRYV